MKNSERTAAGERKGKGIFKAIPTAGGRGDKVFAYGENTIALRLVSKLPDLRAG